MEPRSYSDKLREESLKELLDRLFNSDSQCEKRCRQNIERIIKEKKKEYEQER